MSRPLRRTVGVPCIINVMVQSSSASQLTDDAVLATFSSVVVVSTDTETPIQVMSALDVEGIQAMNWDELERKHQQDVAVKHREELAQEAQKRIAAENSAASAIASVFVKEKLSTLAATYNRTAEERGLPHRVVVTDKAKFGRHVLAPITESADWEMVFTGETRSGGYVGLQLCLRFFKSGNMLSVEGTSRGSWEGRRWRDEDLRVVRHWSPCVLTQENFDKLANSLLYESTMAATEVALGALTEVENVAINDALQSRRRRRRRSFQEFLARVSIGGGLGGVAGYFIASGCQSAARTSAVGVPWGVVGFFVVIGAVLGLLHTD